VTVGQLGTSGRILCVDAQPRRASAVIGVIALGFLLQRGIKVPEPAIVAVAALAGILLHN